MKILFHQIYVLVSLLIWQHICWSIIFDDEIERGWVPIFPETFEWETLQGDSRVIHSRSMVPFCLSYAWTIWKAQGQTINTKMVLNIGQNEKEHGLT